MFFKNCDKEHKEKHIFCVYCGAVIGMFLVDLIPVLGFPVAFVLAWIKVKNRKIVLISLTLAFFALNAFTTLFTYSSTVSFMRSSLTKAAAQQNIHWKPDVTSGNTELTKSDSLGKSGMAKKSDFPISIPGIGTLSLPGIPVINQDSSITDDIPESFTLPEGSKSPTDSGLLKSPKNIKNTDDVKDIDMSKFMKADKQGNIYYDFDKDGKYEVKVDNDGNTHYDNDGDGAYETFYEGEYGEK